jgi:hypothetical protein
MVTKSDALPSKYLKAADIPAQGLPVKIAKIEREKVGTEQKEKWVVYFRGVEKQLVLNGTNWDLIAAALREEDSDAWIGKTIELYPTQTPFGGKLVDCIRVRRHRPSQAGTATPARPLRPAPAAVQEEPPPWDDEVPFVGETREVS